VFGCVYTHTHTHTHTQVLCVYVCAHVHIYTYVHVRAYTKHTHPHIHISRTGLRLCAHFRLEYALHEPLENVHAYIHIHTHIHTSRTGLRLCAHCRLEYALHEPMGISASPFTIHRCRGESFLYTRIIVITKLFYCDCGKCIQYRWATNIVNFMQRFTKSLASRIYLCICMYVYIYTYIHTYIKLYICGPRTLCRGARGNVFMFHASSEN
jgi:hypothetical protein